MASRLQKEQDIQRIPMDVGANGYWWTYGVPTRLSWQLQAFFLIKQNSPILSLDFFLAQEQQSPKFVIERNTSAQYSALTCYRHWSAISTKFPATTQSQSEKKKLCLDWQLHKVERSRALTRNRTYWCIWDTGNKGRPYRELFRL